MKFYKIFLVVITASLYITTNVHAQTVSFPLQGKTREDFSSAYGPRNKGTANYVTTIPSAATGYDYDFHPAIDIEAPLNTNVYPILNGTVFKKETTQTRNNFIVIKHTYNSSDIYIKYMHLTPTSSLKEGNSVIANSTVLGKLLDYTGTGSAHLDFRYFKTETLYKVKPYDMGASHPGSFLTAGGTNLYTTEPILVTKDNVVIGVNTTLSPDIDNGTTDANPKGRYFLTFGVRCYGDELDIVDVQFEIRAKSISNSTKVYNEADILFDGVKNYNLTRVQYDARTNCGDKIKQDDDSGHNSTTMGIYPRMFSSIDSYHTVYFRWYLNTTVWNDCKEIKANIYAADWSGKTKSASSINVVACVGCGGNPNTPTTPTMQTIVYDETPGKIPTIKLSWQNSSTGADYYRIYRCPLNETISNNDYIGMALESSGGTSYYTDQDSRLVPGVTYRYAIAGVNKNGESSNSNELTILFKGELPQSISENSMLSGTWLCKQNCNLLSGYTLSIGPNTEIKFDAGVNLIINGILITDGNLSSPITFTSSSGATPGSWGSITFDGAGASGSSFNYVNMYYGTEIKATNVPSLTIQNSHIENTINGINLYASNGWLISNTIKDVQDHGIIADGVSQPSCYHNTIFKNSTWGNYHSGAGILFNGGSHDYIWNNDIKGFNWGVGTIWGSSPQFGHPANTGINNRITDCLFGLKVYQSSYPIVGIIYYSSSYFYGNSIYGNVIWAADVKTNSSVYAHNVYWGGSSPSYYADGSSYFSEYPWLGADPWLNIPLPSQSTTIQPSIAKNSSIKTTSNVSISSTSTDNPPKTSHFFEGISYRDQKRHKEAFNVFTKMITDDEESGAALGQLFQMGVDSTDNDVLEYFEKESKKNISMASHYLSSIYLKRDRVSDAKKMNDDIIKKYRGTEDEKHAKIQQFYIALYREKNVAQASTILSDVISTAKATNDIEIELATHALNTFIDGTANQSLKRTVQKPNVKIVQQIPTEFALEQNYPNPFNPTTTISYALPNEGMATLKVYDMLGREVATLVNEYKTVGSYNATFDASKLSSGIYIYKLTSGNFTSVKKMQMVK